METTVKEKTHRFKNFVARHKVKIAVVTTTGICLWVHSRIIQNHNEFLKEHDLYDEYYLPTDEDEE